MKTQLTILFTFLFAVFAMAQKVRLEGNNSAYLCLNDSVTQMFERALAKQHVDSTISVLYDYDNGRMTNSKTITIWTSKNQSHIRIVQGCDSLIKDTTYKINISALWQYIKETNFDNISVPINSGRNQSHDLFYHITVTTPNKSFFVVVRDFERNSNEKAAQSDTRVVLTNMIHRLIN